jgi:hypothetical protein
MLVHGSYQRVHRGGRKSPKLEGAGTLGVEAEGLALSGHRDRPVLGFLAGAAGFLLGIALGVAITLALDAFADIDLMTVRKGPGLIGMGSLALGLGIAAAFRTVVGWLFGRLPVSISIPKSAVEGISLNANQLAILWESGDTNHVTLFAPAELSAAELHQQLTGKG